MKPYTEQKTGNIIRRTFSHLVESEELTWHRDREDRIVIPLNENDWMVQFDNELPKKLNVNEEFFIPKETFHRVIKGSVDLMVEIIETKFEDDELVVYEAIEEGKKKKGKKDACYHKVRARYDVWPSAYASGALVKCRKVGAANWGNKTNESEEGNFEQTLNKIKGYKLFSVKDFNIKMANEWVPMWKTEYENDVAKINEMVARHFLYELAQELVGGVEEIDFRNKGKNPVNHFQMEMYLGNIILQTVPFIYVDNNHKVISKRTQIEILNNDYDTIKKIMEVSEESIEEKWSEKYKRSIDCSNPKGFSQRAHCQGRKKNDENIEELEVYEAKKTDFSKEKEQGLHGWFSRKGGEGKSQGWVDCNTCRKDPKTGRKKCKSCGRKDGEERAKYPACRPTPSACGTPKKGESWGKKSNESLSMLENLSIFEPKNYIKNILRESFNQEDTMSEPMTQPAPVKPKEAPAKPFTEPVKQPSRKDKPFLPMPNVQPDPKAIKEGKFDYETYHKTLSSTLDAARNYSVVKGYDEVEFNMNDVQHVAYGHTERFSKELTKNGVPQKKALHVQIYRMESGNYELNMYIN